MYADRAAADSVDSAAAVERVHLSAQVATVGREQKDPVLLVAASRLLALAAPTPTPMTAEMTGGQPDAAGPAPAKVEHTPQALLAEARALAAGNTNTLALIDETERTNLRGAGGGPKFHRQLLGRGAHAKFRADFREKELARVTIVGSRTANLDLVILDDKNNVVCESRSTYDFETCSWTPQRNAYFYLVVENRGNWTNLFSIYTN